MFSIKYFNKNMYVWIVLDLYIHINICFVKGKYLKSNFLLVKCYRLLLKDIVQMRALNFNFYLMYRVYLKNATENKHNMWLMINFYLKNSNDYIMNRML